MRVLTLLIFILFFSVFCESCSNSNNTPSSKQIEEIQLKRGDLISCGPEELGKLDFKISGDTSINATFNHGVKLLHSFEYDEAEKVFAKIIDKEPGCAMAYWGIAMSNFHPLWAPPSKEDLKKGYQALQIARSLPGSKREKAYINSIGAFYNEWQTTDHLTRAVRFEKAMEQLQSEFPDDKEARIFYALSLTAAADPADKNFTKQKKAGDILSDVSLTDPDHPGVVHYLIHTFDSPELAQLALPAAKKYASIAPASAHALHMPSHVFTRLGLWDDCIQSNLASVNSAQCYAQAAGMKGHWDEELHGLDYLVYAYLQKGNNEQANKYLEYLNTIKIVEPQNFKVAYAFAAIPSRYVLENKLWKQASALKVNENFPWNKFPWQRSLVHFTRLLGAVHTNDLVHARKELTILKELHATLIEKKESYAANQVLIKLKAGEAIILTKENNPEGLKLMYSAADMEDKTEKHPVTPGEVVPIKELLAEMLMQLNKPEEALAVYEANLKKNVHRFNGLFGAGLAAEKIGALKKANTYYNTLLQIADPATTRSEFKSAVAFREKHKTNPQLAFITKPL